ncbi:MAG: hypothetical protein IIA45_13190 [Bacteroidetes bacterium]|nr:hypothetical protein [Bacteroidota bacterium]
MIRLLLIAGLLFGLALQSSAQDYLWWKKNVNWDGITHWSSYIISSAAKLGPNALPVPGLPNGHVNNTNSFSYGGAAHFSKGDNTQNAVLRANLNLVEDVVSFDLMMIPIEFFQVSHEVKTERNIFFYHYNENIATGDLYLNTNIQVFQETERFADVMLRIGYRFPTGGLQGAARYTDAPGYYLDMSIGKSLTNSEKEDAMKLKMIGMAGFYAWQTNTTDYFQDDAFLYGLGLELANETILFQTSIDGYYGYINNGDRPMVYRASIEKHIKKMRFKLEFQQGIIDFGYSSIGLTIGHVLVK